MANKRLAKPAETDNQAQYRPPEPNPALRRLDRLVGTWNIKGRTFNSKEDNITGRVAIEWLPGGFFLQLRGELELEGFKLHSLEIVGYDPATNAFSSAVYSSMEEKPAHYQWGIRGDTVTHWTEGSKYTGTFNADGSILAGGWRPEEGMRETAGSSYDATMVRVQ